jgi:Tannase and feruloyl esterase
MRMQHLLFAAWSFCSCSMFAVSQPADPPRATADAQASRELSCDQLAKTEIPQTSITMATQVAAGAFSGPPAAFSGRDLSAFYKALPPFCRIVAEAKPTADSDIKIETWMPVSGWNGKLQGLGNGGFAGLIDYFELGAALSKGYAAVATDAGHTGSPIDAGWALGHPEKVIDFGHRGIHEMTRVAKAAIQAFYGSAPSHSYFAGCSDGGREALMEAQRYPADYDGILAGAPANYWTALLSTAALDTKALTQNEGSFIPQSKIPAIASAVRAACDELDGVRDGIINDPRLCHFDPASIECKSGEDSDKCLSAPQVMALKQIYAGLKDAQGRSVFPGYLPGSEEGQGGWGVWITGPAPAKSAMALYALGYFSNMVYEKSDWDYKSFAMDQGLADAEKTTASALNSTDPDLNAFRARGGKLILYHGWNDPAIPAINTINYFQSVVAKLGEKNTASFARLYMVPGMQHCSGGPGTSSLGQSGDSVTDPQRNARLALEEWVEKNRAPATLIAVKKSEDTSNAQPAMTRPLCPYPQSARYKGNGDTNQSDSFTCVAAKN